MAVCVETVLQSGWEYLVLSAYPVDSCPGLVALDPAEYTGGILLQDLFAIPESVDVAAVWVGAFSLPLLVYLTAWSLGVVVNFINTK